MRKGVTVYLSKKGFFKQEDQVTIVRNFVEEVLNLNRQHFRGNLDLVSLNFNSFAIYLSKNYIKQLKKQL